MNQPITKILPVVFGFDIADYAFARIFHENCGMRSLVVSEIRRGPINDSSIFDTMMVPRGTLGHEESFIALLHQIERAHPDEQLRDAHILLSGQPQGRAGGVDGRLAEGGFGHEPGPSRRAGAVPVRG